jgi:hypothetical protein
MATNKVTTLRAIAEEKVPFDDLAEDLSKAIAILDLLYCQTRDIELRPETIIVAAGEALEHVERVRDYLKGSATGLKESA